MTKLPFLRMTLRQAQDAADKDDLKQAVSLLVKAIEDVATYVES
jgi:hypothetical protein